AADPRGGLLPRGSAADPVPDHAGGADVLQPLGRRGERALAARAHLPHGAGSAADQPLRDPGLRGGGLRAGRELPGGVLRRRADPHPRGRRGRRPHPGGQPVLREHGEPLHVRQQRAPSRARGRARRPRLTTPGHPAPAEVTAVSWRRSPCGPRYGRGVARPRRSSARGRGSSSRRRRSAPASRELPFVGPGERLWVLDVPYGTQVEGASWHPAVSMHLHVGRTLPAHLAPYAPGPHTLGRFLENHLNPGEPAPNPEPAEDLEPRQNQYEAADAIAAHAAAGGRQFLLADEPGVGKTISAVLGATAVGDLRGARRVLVVADRPAAITIGHWCRTI